MSTRDSGKVKKKIQVDGHFLQGTGRIFMEYSSRNILLNKKRSTQETALTIRTFQGMNNRKRKCEHFKIYVQGLEGFPGGSEGKKRLPAMQETQVRSLGQEDPLQKGMTTHSGTLAWKIPWMEKPGRLQSRGSQRGGHN